MHDGVLTHFRTSVILEQRVFADEWIGRGGPTAWLDRSPDITPWNINIVQNFNWY